MYLYLSSPHWHQNTLNTKLADNAKSRHVPRHNIHNYMKNTTHNTKISTLTVTLLNKIERRRIVTVITVVPKEAWVPFGFIVHNLLFLHQNCYHMQLLVFRIVNIKNHYCHTDYQPHKSCDSQTWYTFFRSNYYRFHMYTPDIPICHCVYEVHGLWMSWQFPLLFFEFVDQPIMKTLTVILVWANCEQCVHL